MQEQIDQELERQASRRGPEVFVEPVIRTPVDLARLLYEFSPERAGPLVVTELSAELAATDEHGHKFDYRVSAPAAGQTKRSVLLEGFAALRRKCEIQERSERDATPVLVNGRPMRPPLRFQFNGLTWIDGLIGRWLGGYRDGLNICWNIGGHVYSYDIWQHRLTRRSVPAQCPPSAQGPYHEG